MFSKVLVAEDIDSINVIETLKELGIYDIHHARYCDDALLKIKSAAIVDKVPFDLLLCDLSFDPDHREVKIPSGEKLIETIRKENLPITILVYSIENRPFTIRNLFKTYQIDGYVLKGRKSIQDLKTAIKTIASGEANYISTQLSHLLQDKTVNEIDNYDIELIRQLAAGIPQEKMEARFRELGITPNSKSTIEKRISKLKDYFRANNTVHLVAIAKDLGIA